MTISTSETNFENLLMVIHIFPGLFRAIETDNVVMFCENIGQKKQRCFWQWQLTKYI